MTTEAETSIPAEVAKPKLLSVPVYPVSTFAVQATSNDCYVLLSESHPILNEDGSISQKAQNVIVAALKMSPQSVKDLAIILNNVIDKYERDYGKIVTDFTRTRQDAPR